MVNCLGLEENQRSCQRKYLSLIRVQGVTTPFQIVWKDQWHISQKAEKDPSHVNTSSSSPETYQLGWTWLPFFHQQSPTVSSFTNSALPHHGSPEKVSHDKRVPRSLEGAVVVSLADPAGQAVVGGNLRQPQRGQSSLSSFPVLCETAHLQ